jgi:hypothetical protein
MLADAGSIKANPRALVRDRLLMGGRLWEIVRPGLLTTDAVVPPLGTVYDGDRPWVVLGELVNGRSLVAPLNDARGNPKWWAPQVAASDLKFAGSKDSQIELAHLWSLEIDGVSRVGEIAQNVRKSLAEQVLAYYAG